MFYQSFIKRAIDLSLSILGLLLCSPLFLLIMVCIRLESEGPIFFTQRRIGKNKKEFHIIKFRTMRIDAPLDMPTHLFSDSESYITRVGAYLRKFSLDEIPQLINIIAGDMSIVGPRPALWNQYDLLEERDRYGANNIRPGLTGWAQVNGRDELPILTKARFDGEYVKRICFTFDVKIFFLTISAVLKGKGVKDEPRGHAKQL